MMEPWQASRTRGPWLHKVKSAGVSTTAQRRAQNLKPNPHGFARLDVRGLARMLSIEEWDVRKGIHELYEAGLLDYSVQILGDADRPVSGGEGSRGQDGPR